MLVGSIIMVLFDFFMVAIPSVNIFGSPIGTCICYGIPCGLDLFVVKRIVRNCPSYFRLFAKPVIALGGHGRRRLGQLRPAVPGTGNTCPPWPPCCWLW